MTSSNKAWVTLATNDSYSLGALVLAHSLKNVKTAHKLAILITPGVTTPMRQQIEAVFDDVKVVDVLDSRDQSHLALMSRPELGVTFTKLHCWTLTNYEKCVFLDADTLVLQNCDELFQREELSAAPDPGWPDCFNSGVFVFKPSLDTFGQLLEFARTRGSFDGGDQGLLNLFFKEWAHTDISKHLSFTYNVVWSSTYSYLPALKQFGQDMKIIHFISASKPWLQLFNTETRVVTATSGGTGLQPLLQFWWDLFCQHVHPALSTEMIESRLSSRYSSYVFHPEITPSNNLASNYTSHSYTPNNNTSNDYFIPPYEPPKEDYYTFIDPWEECMVVKEQTNYEVEETKSCHVENVRGDGNPVELCVDNYCEQEVGNNYFKNNCDTEEQTRKYSFQNNVVEECNVLENENIKNEHFEKISEYNKSGQEQCHPISSEHYPACTDDIPINFNSNLSVNNCRPDSPTHCEVPKDQPCDFDGGLAGQFARVSLGEKTADQKALEDFLRRQSWEQGTMDYLGKDSFSNIWAKINETLGKTSEVKIETDAVKKPSPPEVVHTEEPKPLKSALKKTSTTIPPVESELNVDNSEPSVKQLEKLDLSKNILKRVITPDTPTVTSPTPPTTPATQSQGPAETESPAPVKELPKTDATTKESSSPVKQESPKLEPIEPLQETTASDNVSVKEQNAPELDSSVPSSVKEKPQPSESIVPPQETPKSDAAIVKEQNSPESVLSVPSSVKEEPKPSEPIIPSQETPKSDDVNIKEQSAPKSVSSVPSPVKEALQSSETPQKPQTSIDTSIPVVSNDPPVAPKRTKGSPSVPKNAKSSEKK